MDDLQASNMTKRFEGYRDRVYLDTLGNPTGGYGTHLYAGRRIPRYIWDELFLRDYEAASDDADDIMANQGIVLDAVRRAIVVDMIYNLGRDGFLQFQRLLAALKAHDWVMARTSMVESLWFRQVGRRGRILADMMYSGDASIIANEGVI